MTFIGNDWDTILEKTLESNYFQELIEKLHREYTDFTCFPPREQVFRALKLTSYADTRVVLLGQDPYHTPGMANGLSFSVNNGQKMPPSLRNIFKELEDDLGILNTKTDLTPWARQGMLLLNAGLSVRKGEAMSHKHLQWEQFTDQIISALNQKETPVLFVLWGAFAGGKKPLIHPPHTIFSSAHPSPFSAHRGFFGSKIFSRINHWLKSQGQSPIQFQL
ncbi:MAG: uracil-DNA glycosylase [Tissierellia bacterium]|nr:uracil-DNA glycosylase [Tissierellia bacterium]